MGPGEGHSTADCDQFTAPRTTNAGDWLRSVTSYEGNDTQTAHETSIFAKLSLAYVFNTAIIPLAVGVYFSLQVRQPTRHQTGGRGPAAAPLTALLVRRCPTVRSISLGTRRAVWCRRPSS